MSVPGGASMMHVQLHGLRRIVNVQASMCSPIAE